MPYGLDARKRVGHRLDSGTVSLHFRAMAQDGTISERERARVARQAATLRANLLKRKAQQRARRGELTHDNPATDYPAAGNGVAGNVIIGDVVKTGGESAMVGDGKLGPIGSSCGDDSQEN